MNKFLGGTLLWVALNIATPTNAYGQDSTESIINDTNKCVVQLMDSWVSKWEARVLCSLPDDLEITTLENGEICILPKKHKFVENMTEIPDDAKEDSDDVKEEDEEYLDEKLISIPVS